MRNPAGNEGNLAERSAGRLAGDSGFWYETKAGKQLFTTEERAREEQEMFKSY